MLVSYVFLMIILFQTSTNVTRMPWLSTTITTAITAMLMLTVPIPRDRSTVPVIRDTQEMESRVLVSVTSLPLLF